MKQHTPLDIVQCQSVKMISDLDYQKANALRYAAGFVIHAVLKKRFPDEKTLTPFQVELTNCHCLVELLEEDDDEDINSSSDKD